MTVTYSSYPLGMASPILLAYGKHYPTSQADMLTHKTLICKVEKWFEPVHFVVCCSHHHLILCPDLSNVFAST